jgi:hypothetical protein
MGQATTGSVDDTRRELSSEELARATLAPSGAPNRVGGPIAAAALTNGGGLS